MNIYAKRFPPGHYYSPVSPPQPPLIEHNQVPPNAHWASYARTCHTRSYIDMMNRPICVMLSVLIVAATAPAAEQPAWSVRDAAVIIETLNIEDRESQAIIELLLDDYDHAWRQSLNDQEAAVTALAANRPAGDLYLKKCFDMSATYGLERDALAANFEEGMKAFLDPSHQQAWTSLKRAVRRHNTLPQGQLHGERTDLRTVIDTMPARDQILATPDIEPALLAWELSLDPLLIERTRFDRTFPTTYRSLCVNLEFAAALRLAKQRFERQEAIRTLSDSTSAELMAVLTPAIAQSLQDQLDVHEQLTRMQRDVATLYQSLLHWKPDREQDARYRDALILEWQTTRRQLIARLREAVRAADGRRQIAALKKRLGESSNWEKLEKDQFEAKFEIIETDREFAQDACILLGRELCLAALDGQPNAIKRLIPPKPINANPFPEPGPIDPNAPDPFQSDNEPPQGEPFPKPDPNTDTPPPFPGFEPDPNAPDPFIPDNPPKPDPNEPDPFPSSG